MYLNHPKKSGAGRAAERYLHRLARLHKQPSMNEEEVLRAKWHAYAAFALRPWPMLSAKASFSYQDEGSAPLEPSLWLEVTSLDELSRRGDPTAWANWAEGDTVDFVKRPGPAGASV